MTKRLVNSLRINFAMELRFWTKIWCHFSSGLHTNKGHLLKPPKTFSEKMVKTACARFRIEIISSPIILGACWYHPSNCIFIG